MNGNYQLQEIRKRAEELEYLEDSMAVGNLTLARYASSARATMLNRIGSVCSNA